MTFLETGSNLFTFRKVHELNSHSLSFPLFSLLAGNMLPFLISRSKGGFFNDRDFLLRSYLTCLKIHAEALGCRLAMPII